MNILVSFTSFKGKWSWMSFFFFVTVPPAAGMKLWRVSSFFYSGEILFFTPGSVLSPGGCTNTLSPGKHEYLILFCFVERCVCWVKSLIVFSPFCEHCSLPLYSSVLHIPLKYTEWIWKPDLHLNTSLCRLVYVFLLTFVLQFVWLETSTEEEVISTEAGCLSFFCLKAAMISEGKRCLCVRDRAAVQCSAALWNVTKQFSLFFFLLLF